MDEIRHMKMRDFIAYTDIAYGEHESSEEKKNKPREATQADIDRLLS